MNPKLKLLFARRSIRVFRPDPVPDEIVRDLLEAAMAAPSACAKDPWRFIVIQRRESLTAIAAGLPNGKMLAQAPLGIVVCGDLNIAHGNELSYLLQDCSAAIENLLLAAAALNLGSCWLGIHPRPERADLLRHLLHLPESVIPVGEIALGLPGEEKPARTRFREELVRRETW